MGGASSVSCHPWCVCVLFLYISGVQILNEGLEKIAASTDLLDIIDETGAPLQN